MSWQRLLLVPSSVNFTGNRDNAGHVSTTVNETGIIDVKKTGIIDVQKKGIVDVNKTGIINVYYKIDLLLFFFLSGKNKLHVSLITAYIVIIY